MYNGDAHSDERIYVASPRLTTTDVGLTHRLAYARVMNTAPGPACRRLHYKHADESSAAQLTVSWRSSLAACALTDAHSHADACAMRARLRGVAS